MFDVCFMYYFNKEIKIKVYIKINDVHVFMIYKRKIRDQILI